MVASWLLYSTAVSLLLGLAAAAGEAALRGRARGRRWVWLAALAGSVALPVAAFLAPPEAADGAAAVVALPWDLLKRGGAVAAGPAPSRGVDVDALLVAGWASASSSVLFVLVLAHVRLARARRGWGREEVDGVPVWVSRDLGPAALGFFRGSIVVPRWALGLEERLRRLMLLHESEHLRVGDPRLLGAGLAVLAAMPWNVGVWWQFRRLRLAIELDCDARVLRREPDARSYGKLLLEVGRRRAAPWLVTAALAGPQSQLERRIRRMLRPMCRHERAKAVAFAALATGLAVLACETPGPTGAVAEVEAPASRSSDGAQAAYTSLDRFVPLSPEMERPVLKSRQAVQRALQTYYPPLLREAGIGGTVGVNFWIDASGRVVRRGVATSSGHPALDEAALKVADEMEFEPARSGGRAVGVVVAIPIRFQVG